MDFTHQSELQIQINGTFLISMQLEGDNLKFSAMREVTVRVVKAKRTDAKMSYNLGINAQSSSLSL
jgi:hypothetical protein